MRLIPVTLPPGRAKLATSPLPNGSPAATITIGIVAVARLAASGASVPKVTVTFTRGPPALQQARAGGPDCCPRIFPRK
jgi:hypothetical protein